MSESTGDVWAGLGQPVDETGRVLSDDELVSLVRHRPHVLAIMLMHSGDRLLVTPGGVQVEWGPGPDGEGAVVVSMGAVRAAMEEPAG